MGGRRKIYIYHRPERKRGRADFFSRSRNLPFSGVSLLLQLLKFRILYPLDLSFTKPLYALKRYPAVYPPTEKSRK